jgi:transaldolase / glucose-6-phosphate isomerase
VPETITDIGAARRQSSGQGATHENGANRLKQLQAFGQSVWLDYLRRSLFTSGEFHRLIVEDGLRGATSNPSIFEKAIAGSTDYLNALQEIERRHDIEPMALYEALAIRDIRDAADLLHPEYEATKRADGYVSLEVSPYIAHDTNATIDEARRLWKAVDRDNVMIKVPATVEGVPAIRQLVSEGININITLLFGVERYEEVAHAYIDGLSTFVENGGDAIKVASVASFFVSRIDTMVDGIIAKKLTATTDAGARTSLTSLLGNVAIANAKLAYQTYLELCRTPAWRRLAAQGAHPQRLLWASTSTKNPRYRDVRYVEELIGRDTVNTITPATLEAFRAHGQLRASLEEHVENAREILQALQHVGISLRKVTDTLVEEGVTLFSAAFDRLLTAVEKGRQNELTTMLDRQASTLPPDLAVKIADVLADWQKEGKTRRLWAGDATLWTGKDEQRWLGWLGITDDQLAHIGPLTAAAAEVENSGVVHAVLLGMGGSSLASEVMQSTFGPVKGFPELQVLDSTDPAQIARVEASVDLAHTLFIVSSKSGTTLEPNLLFQYFLERLKRRVGDAHACGHFIAITDPDSPLQQVAEEAGFRQVFFGVPSIGGRYSALSNFGLVPATLIGVDVGRLLDQTELMVHSCAPSVPAQENPAVVLGAILATLAGAGHDKVTFISSPAISGIGAWLEQLIAESTGKNGKGLIPITGEALGPPDAYGPDRLFVYLRLDDQAETGSDAAIDALERAGQPVVRIAIADIHDIGQEFFRWEFATAVAGSIMGINPFNQPDVEASKVATHELTAAFEKTEMFPTETPIFDGSGLKLFTNDRNAAVLQQGLDGDRSIVGYLRAHLNQIGRGDYFAMLAYLAMTDQHEDALQAMRLAVRDRTRVATCLGFGPRFLHSTGQAYKGGPNTGVFLQITCDDATDIPVPGQKYSFGVVKAAEARGDFAVLAERNRRALRVHLGADVSAGLHALETALMRALQAYNPSH